MMRRLVAGAAVLIALTASSAPARAQTPVEQYLALWRDTSAALVAFTLVRPDASASSTPTALAALAPGWRRERDRFEAGVVKLIRVVPPSGLETLHWKLLPLHEELVAALSTIVEGADKGDREAVAVGWTWVEQARSTIDRVVGDLRGGGR